MISSVIFLLPLAVAVFWIVRIFLLKDLNKVQLFIVAGMTVALLTMFYRERTALFMFPFFYLAVRQKISAQGVGKWDWLIFLPSTIVIPWEDTTFFTVLLCAQIVGVSIWSIVGVRRYNNRLAELYDTSDESSADDIGQVLTFIIFTAVVTLLRVLLPDSLTSTILVSGIFAIFLSVLQYYIGSLTYRMKDTSEVAAEIESIQEESQEIEIPSAPKTANDKLIQRVLDEELFLDPSLSLVSLAERLHTNRTYLSNSIHACRNQNFSEFINSLRIEYFTKTVKADGGEASIKDAALRSGYNNLQSFYRHFSEIMEMTPKTWISKQAKQ